ncbi:MAG: hypothetical protein IJC37_03450 [Clostridia bacterium]|nr:hypothetical protein [Clostridia bacterium]
MKKAACILLILSVIFSLCACNAADSGKTVINPEELNEQELATLTGAGFNATMAGLVKSNLFFVEEVFIYGHLPVSDSDAVKDGSGNYVPVDSSTIKTIADLTDAVNAVYAEDAAKKLLKGKDYKDIEGKLHYNTKANVKKRSFTFDCSELEISVSEKTDSSCSFTAYLKKVTDSDEKDYKIDCSAVLENGNWKLEKVYY